MTLKDHLLAFLIMCIIDVIIMTMLNLCGITVSYVAAFIIGIVVGIVVLYVYDEIKNG